jgi:hypothetical protein
MNEVDSMSTIAMLSCSAEESGPAESPSSLDRNRIFEVQLERLLRQPLVMLLGEYC